MSEKPLLIPVEIADEGGRLDHFLADRLPHYSRSLLSSAVRAGTILVEGLPRKSSYRLKAGERVAVLAVAHEEEHCRLTPEAIAFPILYEDDDLLLLAKPPGLVVHPGSGNAEGTLVHGLLHHCQQLASVGGDRQRPGIVHRLDKDTSGVMVVAKKETAHRLLVDMFKNHQLEKEYLALVCGVPREESGRIVAPLGRHPVHRQKMAIRPQGGRYAATRWQLLEQPGCGYSLLKVAIETGRTHQIRVHLASLGLPVAGDLLYGGSRARREPTLFPRQMLHAHRLSFLHPITEKPVDIVSEPWPDMVQALEKLRGRR